MIGYAPKGTRHQPLLENMIITPFRTSRIRITLLGVLLSCLSGITEAETRYVTDVLQLSLYEEIESNGKLLERLNSGTELELLETSGFYARVRTPEGVEGWTKVGFLITEKPARAQLAELEEANASLQKQLEASHQALDSSKAELAKVMDNEGQAYAELTERLQKAEALAATVEDLQQENAAFRQRKGGDEIQIPIKWGMIAAGIALLLGSIAGMALFDYRSRRRHGGYRIY
jgi:SH3 domain protein